MNAALLALLIAMSSGVWIYTKLQQKTGYGNSSSAIKGAAIAGVIIFILVFTLGRMILH